MQEGSKIKIKPLRGVLGESDFGAQVAHACILYEDLKIETEGMTTEKQLPLSQADDSKYVRRYFFRRASTTLAETRDLIVRVDSSEHFQDVIQPALHQDGLDGWREALEFANSEDFKRMEQVRQNLAGNSLGESVRHTLEGLREDVTGVLELTYESSVAADVHCHFVGDLTARASVQDRSDSVEQQYEELQEILVRGHRTFIFAMQVLIGAYLVPRFGF